MLWEVWNAEQAERCNGCGTFDWEYVNEDGAPTMPYDVVEKMCLTCLAVTQKRNVAFGRKHNIKTDGRRWFLRRKS